jgi:hypothetical protein
MRLDEPGKVVEHWDVLQIVPFLDDRGVAQGSDERGVVDADAGGSSLDIDKSREIFSADGGARCQIKVIGLDIQQQMLDIARRRAKRRGLDRSIEFRMCEPNSLGIEEPVDFVLAFWMVREVSDQKAFLVEPKALVPQHRFEKTVELARLSGFEVEPGPKVWFSRSVVGSASASAVGQEP